MRMIRDLNTMHSIQNEKAKELIKAKMHPLDPEGKAMAEHKRFTFDIVETPTDPLR